MGFNKKVLSKAVSELGKAKAPGKPRDITVDPMGYWNPANQGKPVRVPGQGNPKGVDITMHNVNQPIWAQPNVGPGAIMYPEDNRHFSGASYVDEYPQMRKGGTKKKKTKSLFGTNKLMLTYPLLRNYKNKIYDPNVDYFQKGGPQNTSGPRNEIEPETIPIGTEMSPDYDLRRFYTEDPMAAETFMAGKGHATDKYKLPNHPTFSNQSMYSNEETPGGEWMKNPDGSWKFKASSTNKNNMSKEELENYFNDVEPGNELEYENGGYIEAELTDEEIQAYRDGGYVVEELPETQMFQKGGALDSYQNKGEVKTFKRDIRDQDAQSNTGWGTAPVQKKTVVTTKKVPVTLKEKLNQTSQQAFDNDFKVVTAKENVELKEKAGEQYNAFKNQQMPGYKDYGPQSAGSADWFWTLPIVGPAALEAAGSLGAMQLPGLSGVPGATLGNLANAGFIAHGITQTPETIKAWDDVSKGKKKWQDAALETGMNLGEFIGSGAGIKSIAQDVNQGSKYLSKTLGTESGLLSHAHELNPLASSVDDVGKGLTQVPKPAWQMQELPGLHLKSTMIDNPKGLHTQIAKDGSINTENALKFIKNNEGEEKYNLVRQAFRETLPKKKDYNDFRQLVQGKLIPLERQFSIQGSDFGLENLGYVPKIQGTMFERLKKLMNTPLSDLTKSRVLENQTMILGNKGKFGRGSNAHGNPEETLGHVHFLRDAETPDVLTITQIQSDAFQGTHRRMPTGKLTKTNDPIENDYIDEIGKYFDKATGENFAQKSLVDKNHQERFLQEFVDYAGKRGDVNKIKVPTSETAAKVQGYSPTEGIGNDLARFKRELEASENAIKNAPQNELIQRQANIEYYKKQIEELSKIEHKPIYSSEHQTILKKYSEQPKTIKKLFGVEPKIVTDSKGNTWYEFNIPDKAKKGKMEIKAFTTTGVAIGTGAALQNKKQGGYVQHELVKAQGGKTVYSGPNRGLVGPSTPKTNGAPTIANAKILEAERKKAALAKQQALAKQKEDELMRGMPKPQVSDNTRTVIPNQAISDINNTAFYKSPQEVAKREVRKKEQAAFEKEQWNKYNKMSFAEKALDRTQATLAHPFLMAGNALAGEQGYIPGMGRGLMNTESPEYDKYLKATGQTKGQFEISDLANIVNPGYWGGHAGNELHKGNYGTGLLETGLAFVGVPGVSRNAIQGAKYLGKDVAQGAKYLDKTLGTKSGNVASSVDDVGKQYIKAANDRTMPIRPGLKDTTLEDEFLALSEMSRVSNGRSVVPVHGYADGNLIMDDLVTRGYVQVDEFIKQGGKINQTSINNLKDDINLWHNKNMIHGDLKSNNTFYNPKTGEIKLIDPVGYPKDFKLTNSKEYGEATIKDINDFGKMFPASSVDDVGMANITSSLNAGISPELIKNSIGPKSNRLLANLIDHAYIGPFFSKTINRYSPLNLIKGYGSKLEGAVKPLGNVLGNSIKNNKLTGGKSLFGKPRGLSTQVGKTNANNIYAAKFDDAVEGSNIRLGEANPQGRFSRKSNATFPIQTKTGVNRYDLPVSDPGVALHRRLPFSNKYVPIDKQKLMNNKFQWSTTGAGLQNVAEKYGKNTLLAGLGYGAYNAYNFDKNKPETFATPEEIKLVNEYNNGQFAESDVPSRAEMFAQGAKESYESPLEYIKRPDPYFLNSIYQGFKKNGGSIESWEDDLDEEEIRLLKEAGFIVEELK